MEKIAEKIGNHAREGILCMIFYIEEKTWKQMDFFAKFGSFLRKGRGKKSLVGSCFFMVNRLQCG